MNIISFNDIIEINGILKDMALNFRIHLRDACGGQSLWIEPMGNCACEGHYEELYQKLEDFFDKKGFILKYWDNKMQFTLEKKA